MAGPHAFVFQAPNRLKPLHGGPDQFLQGPPSGLVATPTAANRGDTVSLAGTNLQGTTSVTLGGVPCAYVVQSNNLVTFTVPGTASSGVLRVTTPIGSASISNFVVFVVIEPPTGITPPAGFTTFYEDQFVDNSAGHWSVYDQNTFGAPDRIQRYMAYNTIFGQGSAGSTGGTSLRLKIQRETVNGNPFTAGMVDTKSRGYYYPRYGWFQFRSKCPHGQGVWPSTWMTAKNGGATTCEIDIQEYFHAQVPGRNSTTIHSTDNAGVFKANRYTNNVGGRTFFEVPTYTPDWVTWTFEIVPVTDSTGNTLADPHQPSTNVRLTVWVGTTQAYRVVDTSALYWTTNGGSEDSFWNIYIQGSQVNGKFVGHPDDPLGYSRLIGACVNGGTAPNSCTINHGTSPGGQALNVIRAGAPGALATMADPATTYELDYYYCAKYTG